MTKCDGGVCCCVYVATCQVSGFAKYKDIVFDGKGIQCSDKTCFGTDKDTGSTISWGPGKKKVHHSLGPWLAVPIRSQIPALAIL